VRGLGENIRKRGCKRLRVVVSAVAESCMSSKSLAHVRRLHFAELLLVLRVVRRH